MILKTFSMIYLIKYGLFCTLTHTYTHKIIDLYISAYAFSTHWTYRSVGSREKKQLSLAPSGSFGILAAVLVGTGGGRFGNTEEAEDSQSGSESKTYRGGGGVCELEGKTGA